MPPINRVPAPAPLGRTPNQNGEAVFGVNVPRVFCATMDPLTYSVATPLDLLYVSATCCQSLVLTAPAAEEMMCDWAEVSVRLAYSVPGMPAAGLVETEIHKCVPTRPPPRLTPTTG